jgi:hypothetical protein
MTGVVELDTSTHRVFIASIARASRTAGRSSARWSWGAAGEEEMELDASSAGTKEQGKTLEIEAEGAETTEQVLASKQGRHG